MFTRIRVQDSDVWRIATRSSPVVVQPVLAVWFGVGWLLGQTPVVDHTGVPIVIALAAILTTAASLLIGARLLGTDSPRRRGLGLATGGCGLAVLISGLVYALIFLPIVYPG
ncbi:hypothetical protein [Mycolicibacter senuensis]|uniref:hypothetical protein n=1 Tax=Mycolicibacter senuensis TaxID=386913 RepID=UPI00256FC083|nr:hypothetical protein [Mycolicibacter senuensis]